MTTLPGSSTVCVAVLRPAGSLEIINLGDCGVRVIRAGKCVFQTQVRQPALTVLTWYG